MKCFGMMTAFAPFSASQTAPPSMHIWIPCLLLVLCLYATSGTELVRPCSLTLGTNSHSTLRFPPRFSGPESESMRDAWGSFSKSIPPYRNAYAGNGIVIGNIMHEHDFLYFRIWFRHLRWTGCTLPVEVWAKTNEFGRNSSFQNWIQKQSNLTLRSLQELNHLYVDATQSSSSHDSEQQDAIWMQEFKSKLGFSNWTKPLLLLHSKFRRILFMELAVIPLSNPDALFLHPLLPDSSAVFWPPSVSCGRGIDREEEKVQDCRARKCDANSDMFIVDKKRFWESLYLSALLSSPPFSDYLSNEAEAFYIASVAACKNYEVIQDPPFQGNTVKKFKAPLSHSLFERIKSLFIQHKKSGQTQASPDQSSKREISMEKLVSKDSILLYDKNSDIFALNLNPHFKSLLSVSFHEELRVSFTSTINRILQLFDHLNESYNSLSSAESKGTLAVRECSLKQKLLLLSLQYLVAVREESKDAPWNQEKNVNLGGNLQNETKETNIHTLVSGRSRSLVSSPSIPPSPPPSPVDSGIVQTVNSSNQSFPVSGSNSGILAGSLVLNSVSSYTSIYPPQHGGFRLPSNATIVYDTDFKFNSSHKSASDSFPSPPSTSSTARNLLSASSLSGFKDEISWMNDARTEAQVQKGFLTQIHSMTDMSILHPMNIWNSVMKHRNQNTTVSRAGKKRGRMLSTGFQSGATPFCATGPYTSFILVPIGTCAATFSGSGAKVVKVGNRRYVKLRSGKVGQGCQRKYVFTVTGLYGSIKASIIILRVCAKGKAKTNTCTYVQLNSFAPVCFTQ